MSEVKSLRIQQAAGVYNNQAQHIVDFLTGKGFEGLKITSKLTPEMISMLDKEYGDDKALKKQADKTSIDKTLKETVEMKQDNIATHKKEKEEKDVLITNNNAPKEKEKDNVLRLVIVNTSCLLNT